MYTLHVPGGSSPTVQGGVPIKDKINEQLDGASEVKQLSWSHQLSISGSLVLSVAGQLLGSSDRVRRFAQTFLLASEKGNPNAYYIHNDICCFFDDFPVSLVTEAQHPAHEVPTLGVPPAAQELPSNSPSPTFGSSPVLLCQEAPADICVDTLAPSSPELKAKAPDPIAAPPQPKAALELSLAHELTQFKPSSWAGITALKCPAPVLKECDKPAPVRRATLIAGADSEDAPEQALEPTPEECSHCSVFVSGVPSGCEKENLDTFFDQFGEVRKIVVKSDKHYAIVDFVNPIGAKAALDATAPKFQGSLLKIEKRRDTEPRTKGVRRGDGRGNKGRSVKQENASAESQNGFTTAGKGGKPRRAAKQQ